METKNNLLKAFAGECQARMRYEIAAQIAAKNDLFILQKLFNFTANQEKEHALIFYNFLKEIFKDDNVTMEANYPIDLDNDLDSLLEQAANHEYDEATKIYPEFSKIAKEEGYTEIAAAFAMIAEIENYHHERFKKYFHQLTTNTLFKKHQNIKWMCLNCGFIYEGNQAITTCPVCKYSQGYNLPLDSTPYHL